MFDIKTVEIELGDKTLKLETGRVARQADGAVIATLGETVVLCAVTAAKTVKQGQDFFPLTVHYQEKFSAAGRIPGGFFKRERGATEKETLTSRLIDRPIRPLFPEGFYNEVLVIAQVLSYDGENEPDIVAMIAASAALTISGVPFMGPIGAARVGFSEEGEYILNPTQQQVAEGKLDLVVAGTPERRDDGGIGSQGADRRADARRRHVRPQGQPAGLQGDHQPRRKGRQGPVGARPHRRQVGDAREAPRRHRQAISRPPTRSPTSSSARPRSPRPGPRPAKPSPTSRLRTPRNISRR